MTSRKRNLWFLFLIGFSNVKIFILVPVFNEESVFGQLFPRLVKVAEELSATIVVVDDGSSSPLQFNSSRSKGVQTSSSLLHKSSGSDRSSGSNIVRLRHSVNCGVGAALGTGMAYAKAQGADIVLSIDGDGQHDPEDLKKLVDVLKMGEADIANGSRFLTRQKIPLFRRCANYLANIITFLLSGFWITDSQTGMKGYSSLALEKIDIKTPGYEWCIDIFREANWYGLSVKEVPISVVYNLYTLRKGQGFAMGLDMVARLFVRSLMK